jgi:FkbM family methyltransferase
VALINWLQRNVYRGETWFDVGAHYGYTTIALAELVGTSGCVYAFEPSLTTAGYLNRTRLLNNLAQVTVVPFGLGGAGDLRIASVPVARGMANHAFGGPQLEAIYIVGFDHLRRSLGWNVIDGVKMDVQGMEFEALAGMSETLADLRPKLVIEFHSGVDRQPILDLLTRVGYRLPATAVDPLISEVDPAYLDDRSYAFEPKPR